MAPETLTVAVLGQGSIGRRHAGLAAAEGCRVLAWDPVAPPLETPGVTRVPTAEAALDGADAAIVASPSSLHLEQAALALGHGCHVLVEKPVSVSAAGVPELAERASAAGRVLAVAMNLRFHPGPSAVRRLVREGGIGRPLLAHVSFGSYLPGWRPGTDYRRSYSARAELGGGVALDAIHELDYLAWVLGEATEVSAQLRRVSDLELDVEDAALFVLAHAGGALATVALDYLDRAYRRGCRVVGSEASVEWRWDEERVRVLDADGHREVAAPSDVAPSYRGQMRAFLDAVRAGQAIEGSPLATVQEGLHAVRIVDAARASAAGGRRIELGQP